MSRVHEILNDIAAPGRNPDGSITRVGFRLSISKPLRLQSATWKRLA